MKIYHKDKICRIIKALKLEYYVDIPLIQVPQLATLLVEAFLEENRQEIIRRHIGKHGFLAPTIYDNETRFAYRFNPSDYAEFDLFIDIGRYCGGLRRIGVF